MTTIARTERSPRIPRAPLQAPLTSRWSSAKFDKQPPDPPTIEKARSVWVALSLLGLVLFLIGVGAFCFGAFPLARLTVLGFAISGVAHLGDRWFHG